MTIFVWVLFVAITALALLMWYAAAYTVKRHRQTSAIANTAVAQKLRQLKTIYTTAFFCAFAVMCTTDSAVFFAALCNNGVVPRWMALIGFVGALPLATGLYVVYEVAAYKHKRLNCSQLRR